MYKNNSLLYKLTEFSLPQLSFPYMDTILRFWPLLVGIIGALGAIFEIRPKIKGDKTLWTYIDYATNELIEGKEYEFSWGHILWGRIFPQKVSLPILSRDSTFQLLYKPSISYKQTLPRDQYEVVERGSKRIITLIDKKFFDEAEINCVNIEITSSVDEEYKMKIKSVRQQNFIVITNDNYTEIRNYPVELPSNIGYDRLINLFGHGSEIITPNPEGSSGIKVMIQIPARQANSPGKKVIPLQ